jgi:hypothetical protein
MKKLTVFINNENVHEFDREISLIDEQLAFLEKMDSDMDKGIKVNGELLANPDKQQRGTFVVMNLIKALQQENDAIITASGTYLINRFPELLEVHANDYGKTVKIELIEDDCD